MVKYNLPTIFWTVVGRARNLFFHPHRDAFNGLDDKGRWSILDGPLNEIVRLLEENLLQKFWQTELHRQGTVFPVISWGNTAVFPSKAALCGQDKGCATQ